MSVESRIDATTATKDITSPVNVAAAASADSTSTATMGVVRVYKKQSANGKLTVYLGSRDFGDHGSFCDQVEGIVIVSTDYLKGRKVFGQVITTFRYGREEDEVMGLHFSRQLYLASDQIVPPRVSLSDMIVSKLQDKLLKRFGEHSYPFTFDLPVNAPPSVTLQPGPEDRGPPLGVDYELRLFVGDDELDKPSKRSTIGMAIRKLQYSLPSPVVKQPSAVVSRVSLYSAVCCRDCLPAFSWFFWWLLMFPLERRESNTSVCFLPLASFGYRISRWSLDGSRALPFSIGMTVIGFPVGDYRNSCTHRCAHACHSLAPSFLDLHEKRRVCLEMDGLLALFTRHAPLQCP